MTDQIETPTEEKPATKRAPRAAAKTEALPQDIGSIIPRIREDLGFVGKDQQTESGTRYNYRGHDQIVNAIVPLFDKYGVYTTVEDKPVFYEGRNAGTKYVTAVQLIKAVTFWAPDGSSRTSTVLSESTDYSNKATGQAGTYAYRIALEQTFTIPTGRPDPDADASEQEPTQVLAQPQAAAQPSTAASDDAVKVLKQEIAAAYQVIGIPKEKIPELGTAYFNGRAGWDSNAVALGKLLAAIQAGEESAIGK